MKKFLTRAAWAAVAVLGATAAQAAGDGTGIQAGFSDIGTDLNTLLNGAGGFIVVIISIGVAAIMLAIGRGWGQTAVAFGVAMLMGYGVTALQGVSGVSAPVDFLAEPPAAIEAIEVPTT
jgi:hypothetical protein